MKKTISNPPPVSNMTETMENQFTIEMCDASIKRHSDEPQVFALRADAKSFMKDHKGAAEDYNSAIALDPENPYYYYHSSIEKSYLMDYDGAKADITRSIEIRPCFAPSHLVKGLLEYYTGNFTTALIDFDETIILDPTQALAWFCKGVIKYTISDGKEGQEDVEKGRELGFNETFKVNRGQWR